MSMLHSLSQEDSWKRFYEYKTSLVSHTDFEKYLREFIYSRSYLPVCEAILRREPFALPSRSVINKQHSQKKRVVYCYPQRESTVLKLLTFFILRKYDHLFCRNLYSFRPGCCAKDAVKKLTSISSSGGFYTYKADISNYFNSIPLEQLIPMLRQVITDDPELLAFLEGLLTEEHVIDRGRIITDQKGIMAGTPLSAFYANLYLRELDEWFYSRNIPYARYSDDIIVFSESPQDTQAYADRIRSLLGERGLLLNPEKECFSTPEEGWSFLGFHYRKGVLDIAPVTVSKLKKKMRRKTRALKRWSERGGLSGEKAAKAFIRIFNRKLLESPEDSELSWSGWFFSVINTDESLREIDHYSQDCLRFLLSGTHTKSRFNVRYSELKELGYKSLCHSYYDVKARERIK